MFEMKEHIKVNSKIIEERRLWGFFSFVIWPLMPFLYLSIGIWKGLKGLTTKRNLAYFIYSLLLPFFLIKLGWHKRNLKIVFGVVFLLPFMVSAFLSIIGLIFHGETVYQYSIPQPPSSHHWFGTNGEGLGIGSLLILGAKNSYFISLIAMIFVLVAGILLGKWTSNLKANSVILFFAQVVETIPILFLLLIILAIFTMWGDEMRNYGGWIAKSESPLRTIILGLSIGLGFLPQIVRLIREKIKTFISEDFVDAAKAHGIPQKRIMWFHIIRKNCLGDIIITITQIWGMAFLTEINLSYLFNIGSSKLGAECYPSWAQMLLTQEARSAIIFLNNWWLFFFPALFIIITIMGFYLFGDGLKDFYEDRTYLKKKIPIFDYVLSSFRE